MFHGRDRVLIAYVRAYATGDIDETTFARLVDPCDESTAVGISLLSGIYIVVALFGDAIEFDPEEPFVGWDLSWS